MSGIDTYTKLLLHGAGVPGSTAIVDSSPWQKTPAANGAAALSAEQAKFGATSIKLTASSGDYVSVPHSADFDFGAGDFTLDGWVFQTPAQGTVSYLARERAPTWPAFILGYGGAYIYMSSNKTAWDIAEGKQLGSPVLNKWSHVEVGRQGNTFFAFRDGVLTDQWTSSLALAPSSSPLSIGSCQGGTYMNGYISELRVSKGVCRHTANFTPETEPYTAPPPPVGVAPTYGQVVAAVSASNQAYVDLIDPYAAEYPCDHYQIEFIHAVSDIETPPNAQPGALLTAYVSTDGGQSFHTGPHYNNTGLSNFPGESNPTYLPQPFALGLPQTLNLGMRLSIDTGDTPGYGATGVADVFCAGGNILYTCNGYKGAIGGNANSPKPAILGGGVWFPSNGSSPFHWAIPASFAGHFDGAPGLRPNGFRLMMNGGGNNTAIIESGIFKLRRMD